MAETRVSFSSGFLYRFLHQTFLKKLCFKERANAHLDSPVLSEEIFLVMIRNKVIIKRKKIYKKTNEKTLLTVSNIDKLSKC